MFVKVIFRVGYGVLRMSLALFFAGVVMGCASNAQTVALVGGVTGTVGSMPTQEVEQIYYLGVFDPQEQVDPTIYRVRVHGQASAMSFVRFGSGWVRAELIDSLNSTVGFDDVTNRPEIQSAAAEKLANLKTGRRLMMFGPEGFREAPKDHRLVIVMGGSPERFFQAIDQSLGVVAHAREVQRHTALSNALFREMLATQGERDRLDVLRDMVPPAPQPVQ